MVFRHKASEMQLHTAGICAQNAEQRERLTIRAAAALCQRNRTEMYNDAARSAAATLRQHRISMDPDSIDNAKCIQRATRDLSRLVNPGPLLLEGPAPHAFYINAEVSNVESGVKEEYHFDHRHRSTAWIWDNTTVTYIPRHYGVIDLTE